MLCHVLGVCAAVGSDAAYHVVARWLLVCFEHELFVAAKGVQHSLNIVSSRIRPAWVLLSWCRTHIVALSLQITGVQYLGMVMRVLGVFSGPERLAFAHGTLVECNNRNFMPI